MSWLNPRKVQSILKNFAQGLYFTVNQQVEMNLVWHGQENIGYKCDMCFPYPRAWYDSHSPRIMMFIGHDELVAGGCIRQQAK